MYEDFLGLNTNPFQLSPDPYFLYSSEQNKIALASIAEAVRQRKGFVALTGEVGTGKTLVLRCLFEVWEREEIPFAYFIGPRLSTTDFLSYITFELGITVAEPTKGNLLRALYGFLLAQFEKGLTTILVIDEAHQMPRSVLEEIRVLANFETAQQKLIQIVLVGQPELDRKLDSVELRSLKQRIAVRCQLRPLREEETFQYIKRRLEVAGAGSEAATIFPEQTVKAIHRYSLGIPRLVNSICDQALTTAFTRQIRVVPVEIINAVAVQFRLDPASRLKQTERPFPVGSPVERSSPDQPREVVSSPNARDLKSSDGSANLRNPSADLGTSSSTVPPAKPDNSSNIRLSADSSSYPIKPEQNTLLTREAARQGSTSTTQSATFQPAIGEAAATSTELPAITQSDQALADGWTFEMGRWIKPGIRFLLIAAAAVVVPVSLATGIFVARRRAGPAAVRQQLASAIEAIPIGETTGPALQPVEASSRPEIDVGTVDRVNPRNDDQTPKFTERPEHLTPLVGKLSKPIVAPRRPPASIDPPIITSPIKEQEIGNIASNVAPSAALGLFPGMAAPSTAAAFSASGSAKSAPTPVGGRIEEPRLLSHTMPAYPMLARQSRTEGDVTLEVVIDTAGDVRDLKVVSGPSVLRQSALDAVRNWKYEPSMLNGRPMPVQMLVTVRFRL